MGIDFKIPAAESKGRRVKRIDEPTPDDYQPRVSSLWKVGAHVSAAGGVENAVQNAAAIG
jgi:AP endonuclease-1